MEKLLIYKTIASPNDTIKFSALYDEQKESYYMPSLTVEIDGKEVMYADSERWMINTLLPALGRFENRTLSTDDKEHLDALLVHFPSIYDQIDAINWTKRILEYAELTNMLYVGQESITTET